MKLQSMILSAIVILTLMIAPITTQGEVYCNEKSPDCCWVVKIWKDAFKQKTLMNPKSSTACCLSLESSQKKGVKAIPGITCRNSTKGTAVTTEVTRIYWRGLLKGSIPADFSNLRSLEILSLSHNKLKGSIPKQIVTMGKLGIFDVEYNSGLNGKFTRNCNTKVYADGTDVYGLETCTNHECNANSDCPSALLCVNGNRVGSSTYNRCVPKKCSIKSDCPFTTNVCDYDSKYGFKRCM